MKSKIIKITAFLLLVIVGCFITFHFSNKEKIKADTPSLYYWSVDTSHENYMTIIFYLLDIDYLTENTGTLHIYGQSSIYEWEIIYTDSNTQFLRYSQLDHDDYDAYIYTLTYPNIPVNYTALMVMVYPGFRGENGNITVNNFSCAYHPTFKQYYEDGKVEGYSNGVNDRNAYWEDYIQDTYESTTGSGYQRIFENGRQAGFTQGQESIDTTDWLQSVATDVGSILNIKLMPFITIGGLIFIPLMFTILGAILWIWRRK